MKSFVQAVSLVALTSFADAEFTCSFGIANATVEYPLGDCGMPEWLAVLNPQLLGIPYAAEGSALSRYDVTTSDGYILTMLRFGGRTSTPINASTFGKKGPVLLHHGFSVDGLSWLAFDPNNLTGDPTDPTFLPQTLYDEGYDVWIVNARGTKYSLGHTDFDYNAGDSVADAEANGAVDYWNWGIDEAATIDVPAMIDEILAVRKVEDPNTCQKVNVVTHSKGSTYSLIAANAFPTTAEARIQAITTLTPCWVPRIDSAADPNASATSTRRALSHNYYGSWDRQAYYAEFYAIRAELSHWEYSAFYYAYRDWERANYYTWWKNDNWKTGIQEALCSKVPSNSRCQPADQKTVSDLETLAIANGVTHLYGEDWAADLIALCGSVVADYTYICEQIARYSTVFEEGSNALTGNAPVPVRLFTNLGQQAVTQQWSKYDADFATAFMNEPELYSMADVNIPVNNIYVKDDETCSELVNQPIGDTLTTQSARITYTDGRTHGGAVSIVGDNDANYTSLLLGLLGGASDTLDCASLDGAPWE